MKAIRVQAFGEPEVLRVEDVPISEPRPQEVLVRVHAIGVNPVETYIRSGKYAKLPALPYTPGTDASGTVERLGPEVKSLAIGQRVYTAGTMSGSYAEFALCRADQVHPLPEPASFEQGAALHIPYATAYRALVNKATARTGERVLIHGASGGVGIAALQIAKIIGTEVFGTAGTEQGCQLVREQGGRALDHTRPDYLEELKKLTHGQGVNVIIEMLANVNLVADLSVLAVGGRIVVVGSRGALEFNPRDAMLRDAAITGMMLAHASPGELSEIHAWIRQHLASGGLKPIIGRRFSLADAADAHRAVMERGAHGKIVLVP